MNNSYQLIKKIIADRKYRLVKDDGEFLTIKYQMNSIHIYTNSEDEHFVSLVLTDFASVTEENYLHVLATCHKLNAQMKQVKLYTSTDIIIAACEFCYLKEEDLDFQIQQALSALIAAKVNYRNSDR